MHNKLAFPLVPVPSYLPNMHELECSDVRKIEDTAFAEARRLESEILVIMDELQGNQEQHDVSKASFLSSFTRIQSDELNPFDTMRFQYFALICNGIRVPMFICLY